MHRLIEFETNGDILRYQRLKLGNGLLDTIDDSQRRRIGAFGDGDVHGAPPVDERVGGHDVGPFRPQ